MDAFTNISKIKPPLGLIILGYLSCIGITIIVIQTLEPELYDTSSNTKLILLAIGLSTTQILLFTTYFTAGLSHGKKPSKKTNKLMMKRDLPTGLFLSFLITPLVLIASLIWPVDSEMPTKFSDIFAPLDIDKSLFKEINILEYLMHSIIITTIVGLTSFITMVIAKKLIAKFN